MIKDTERNNANSLIGKKYLSGIAFRFPNNSNITGRDVFVGIKAGGSNPKTSCVLNCAMVIADNGIISGILDRYYLHEEFKVISLNGASFGFSQFSLARKRANYGGELYPPYFKDDYYISGVLNSADRIFTYDEDFVFGFLKEHLRWKKAEHQIFVNLSSVFSDFFNKSISLKDAFSSLPAKAKNISYETLGAKESDTVLYDVFAMMDIYTFILSEQNIAKRGNKNGKEHRL